MIANEKMSFLVEQMSVVEVPPRMSYLFMGGFKDVEGCTFLRAMFHHDRLDAMSIHQDRTGYEAAVNKLFVEDYLEPDATRELLALVASAVTSARELVARLERAYPNDVFNVVVSASETELRRRRATSSLRFFRLREGESWLAPDIEAYEEAVAVLNTRAAQDR